MQSSMRQACSQVPSLGVPAVPSRVFPVFLAVELTGQGREPSETCAVEGVCLHQPKFGVAGTAKSISTRRGEQANNRNAAEVKFLLACYSTVTALLLVFSFPVVQLLMAVTAKLADFDRCFPHLQVCNSVCSGSLCTSLPGAGSWTPHQRRP